ncbi:MAG TPA: helix-turn-helix domain-containing protein [Thermodesulfobacteriota bacterium]|nr:helix-turn-helix domain-containing protein [Thermodesulfobacteriota bacterium]
MKGIKDQTYYEILEVSPTATDKEIQRAYDHAKETFHTDSLAVYSLFSEAEVGEIQEAVEKAYRVLMDEVSRRDYDQSHIQAEGVPPAEKPSEAPQVPPQQKKASLSFTGISFSGEEGTYRGKMLKQVRERMGVEIQTISKETKINVKILEWIEEEAFEKLPPVVYLKGFLKGYAQSLGLNPQKVVEEYLRFMGESKKK